MPIGLQIDASAVGDNHILNFELHDLAVVLAVIQVVSRDNLRFLDQELIEALLFEGAASERNGRVTELDQAVTHPPRKL